VNGSIHGASSVLAAGGSIGNLVGGVAPNWGPFAAVGTTAQTIIEAIMAAAIIVCLGTAVWGASQIRLGNSNMGSHDTVMVDKGRKMLVSSLIGVFIVGSLGTLFTIVYGLAI
jgi:hypothetical protein